MSRILPESINYYLKKGTCFLFIGLVVVITGCGYQLVGRGDSRLLSLQTVTVPIFENKSNEPRLEVIFTNAMINRLLKSSQIRVVSSGEATATVEGNVYAYRERIPISFDQENTVAIYQLEVLAEIKIRDNDTGQIIWDSGISTTRAEYDASSNSVLMEAQEQEAKKKAAFKFARQVFVRWEGS